MYLCRDVCMYVLGSQSVCISVECSVCISVECMYVCFYAVECLYVRMYVCMSLSVVHRAFKKACSVRVQGVSRSCGCVFC